MNAKTYSWIAAVLANVVATMLFGVPLRTHMRESQIDSEVLAAIQTKGVIARLDAESHLRETKREDAVGAIARLLNRPEVPPRRAAARAVVTLRAQQDLAGTLASHLLNDSDNSVRLSCAICLMRVRSLAVRDAYIQALHDP